MNEMEASFKSNALDDFEAFSKVVPSIHSITHEHRHKYYYWKSTGGQSINTPNV